MNFILVCFVLRGVTGLKRVGSQQSDRRRGERCDVITPEVLTRHWLSLDRPVPTLRLVTPPTAADTFSYQR